MLNSQRISEELTAPTPILFGSQGHLVGMFQPPSSLEHHGYAVVILTAGMLPSAGPFRLHVDLAASLAKAGISSLRFDLSGIGESLAIGGGGTSLQRAASEIRAAIDYLEIHQQVNRIALFGLCSGADDALYAAIHDYRICGVFSIDGCGYRTARYYLERIPRNYLPKLTSRRAWSSTISKVVMRTSDVPPSLMPASDIREFPDRETAAIQLHRLIRRGVRLHFHYTGGVGEYFNYREQFRDMFHGTDLAKSGDIEQIGVTFSPECDHVAYLVEHRRRLVALATERLVAMSVAARESRD